MGLLQPVRSLFRDHTHQHTYSELIAVAHYLFEFGEIKLIRLRVAVDPGKINPDDVEVILLGDGPEHLPALFRWRIGRPVESRTVNELIRPLNCRVEVRRRGRRMLMTGK